VVLNGGLWLGEPDVDSLTWLTEPVRAVRVRDERVMLARGIMAPINTQNTAFHRDLVPAFYFVPVGEKVGGIAVERYGDIWAGFLAKKLIDHLDDLITFGVPACDYRCNVHRLLHDLELEFWSVVLTDGPPGGAPCRVEAVRPDLRRGLSGTGRPPAAGRVAAQANGRGVQGLLRTDGKRHARVGRDGPADRVQINLSQNSVNR
jgi:hypothetical protein